MKSNSKVWAVLIVIAIIAISGNFFPKGNTIVERIAGARSGPDTDSQCTAQNGLIECKTRRPLSVATTTPCSVKSPTSTSTLARSSVMITTASSTATTWTLAKATTPFATTTLLATYTLSSAVQGTMVSTSTDAIGVDNPSVFAPNTYVVWGMAGIGSSYDATKLVGSCTASFYVN